MKTSFFLALVMGSWALLSQSNARAESVQTTTCDNGDYQMVLRIDGSKLTGIAFNDTDWSDFNAPETAHELPSDRKGRALFSAHDQQLFLQLDGYLHVYVDKTVLDGEAGKASIADIGGGDLDFSCAARAE